MENIIRNRRKNIIVSFFIIMFHYTYLYVALILLTEIVGTQYSFCYSVNVSLLEFYHKLMLNVRRAMNFC